MDRNRKRKREASEDVRNISKNTLKKQRQRAKIREDPVRLAETRRKDRERKKKARETRKNYLKQHPLIKNEAREKKRLQMKRYREKKKETQENSLVEVRRSHAAKQREARKKDKQRKQEEAGKKKLEEMKRKQEVLRVKNWRMRIQLKTNTKDPDAENKNSTEKNNSPFQTSSTERRAPRRKARILEKLVESPSSRKSLEKKGVLPTAETQTSLKISEGIIRSLAQQLNEVKPTGGASTSRRTAYGILKNIINKSGKFARTSLRKKLDLRKEKPKKAQETEWWNPKTRKPRKDRVPDQCQRKN